VLLTGQCLKIVGRAINTSRERANVHHFDLRKSSHLQPSAATRSHLPPRAILKKKWFCRFYFFFQIVCSI
jgi:hypothetical protein